LSHVSTRALFFLVLLSHAAGGREDLSRVEPKNPRKTASPKLAVFLFCESIAATALAAAGMTGTT
jgi:hypothetical protein